MAICCVGVCIKNIFYTPYEKFSETPEGNQYHLQGEEYGSDWERTISVSIVSAYIFYPLANLHNKEMNSDHSCGRKFFTVSLCALGMTLGGLIGGPLEAIIRVALGVISCPLLLCACETGIMSVGYFFYTAAKSIPQMYNGIEMAYNSFYERKALIAPQYRIRNFVS